VHRHREAFDWVVSTDAHSPAQLERMHLGLAQARKAWLEPDDVLNTRDPEEVVDHLRG